MSIHIAIKVAYFNTKNFAFGFQIQPNVETIFGLLLKALKKSGFMNENDIKFLYAGRTDHGVNAISQVISFNLDSKFTDIPIRFLHRINSRLPLNIRCWAYSIVPNDFNPRFHALERQYCYIYTKNSSENLDVSLMKDATKILLGTHNFINFAKRNSEIDNFVREMKKLTIEENNNVLIIKLHSKSFLWQQCRRITAHLLQIGKKQISINETYKLLSETDNITKPTPSPPENLFLTDIKYQDIEFIEDMSVKLKIFKNLDDELHSIRTKENSLIYLKNFLNNS